MEINTSRKKPDYLELFAKQIQPDAVYSGPVMIIPVSEHTATGAKIQTRF